ncbi:hypothetical protein SPI_06399 [Niveomyces insectorum RCEF 264]|uniref:Uncharacterized protein n=1 Tax=Niveomyces insectorum RCEF 264 TaxID=1081102 RepID=A0A167S3K5_9HYPO|nr:hypothetical protein SPI_06399 [Niveomyces insectorum RCEF 264]
MKPSAKRAKVGRTPHDALTDSNNSNKMSSKTGKKGTGNTRTNHADEDDEIAWTQRTMPEARFSGHDRVLRLEEKPRNIWQCAQRLCALLMASPMFTLEGKGCLDENLP